MKAKILCTLLFTQTVWAGDWSVHQGSLQTTLQNIEVQEKELKDAAIAIQKAPSADVRRAAEEHMNQLLNSIREEKAKYQKEIKHVRYQHPERGQELDLHLKGSHLVVLEPDVESTSFEQLLEQVRGKMISVYGDYGEKRIPANQKFKFLIEAEEQKKREAMRPVLKVK